MPAGGTRLRARFESTPPPVADADGLAYSAGEYRAALAHAGVSLDAPHAAAQAWFIHGVALPWAGTRPPDEHVDTGLARIVLEPRLAAGEPDAAARAFLERARLVVTTCEATRRRLEECVPAQRLVHLAPFCDLAGPVEARRGREALRGVLANRLGIPAASAWLVTAGGEDADSLASFDLLLRALSRLVMLDWRLLVASEVASGGPLEAALLRLPRERVRVVPQALRAGHDALLAAGDLFVWPAVGGVGRHQLLRAHAVGLAAVACKEKGVSEIVRDALTGRLAPAGNAESFANCVAFLLRQGVFRKAFGSKALETVIDQHDALAAGRRLRALFADIGLA